MSQRTVFLTILLMLLASTGYWLYDKNNRLLVEYLWKDYNNNTDNVTLFVGSSTIARWPITDVDSCLPGQLRGFHNGLISHVRNYLHLTPVEPSRVVLYVGENDIYYGADLETLISRLEVLVDSLLLNNVKEVLILKVKYSPIREKFHQNFKRFNVLMQDFFDGHQKIQLIQMDELVSSAFYLQDGIHLNRQGYDKLSQWTNKLCKGNRVE